MQESPFTHIIAQLNRDIRHYELRRDGSVIWRLRQLRRLHLLDQVEAAALDVAEMMDLRPND